MKEVEVAAHLKDGGCFFADGSTQCEVTFTVGKEEFDMLSEFQGPVVMILKMIEDPLQGESEIRTHR